MAWQATIFSVHNEWIKSIRRLHHRADRVEQNRFLIEGTHAIEEAVANKWPLEAICFDAKWGEQYKSFLSRLSKEVPFSKTVLQPVSDDVIRKLTTTDSPCSVIGIATVLKMDSLARDLETQTSLDSFIIAVESLQDPGNLGTLIRASAACGNGSIVVSHDSVDPTNPKVLRSTAGQWFRNPPAVVESLPAWVKQMKQSGFQVLAASAEGKPLWDCDLTSKTVLLLGNEGAGLSAELRFEATATVSVPMADGVESLNVAVTGALIAYESMRQRRYPNPKVKRGDT